MSERASGFFLVLSKAAYLLFPQYFASLARYLRHGLAHDLVHALKVASILFLVFAGATAQALPPEHEAQRLLQAADAAVTDAHWDEAAVYLNQLQALSVDKPSRYYFLRGQVMFQAGHLKEAQESLERYVVESGKEGSNYSQALALITRIEQARAEKQSQSSQDAVAEIHPANEDYVAGLQKLYLNASPVGALIEHLNSLLALNGWRGDARLLRASTPLLTGYKIQAGAEGSFVLQTSQRDEAGEVRVRAAVIDVFGVSPLVKFDCTLIKQGCWIIDPRDNARWLHLSHDETAAREIAQALGELIRQLQKTR